METFRVYSANEKYKGADIVANYLAEELLDFFIILTPYLGEIFTGDVDVSVIREGCRTPYTPGRSFDFKVRVGDPMQGKTGRQCMATGQEVAQKVSKEQSAFGVPYIACAYPFKDGNKVVGCAITARAVDTQEEIQHISNNLATSAQGYTAGMEKIIATTTQLVNIPDELGSFNNQLTSSIKQIDKVVASIGNVARQTDLLALNTSIEITHVDAFGKGFDVVASEMRKLVVGSDESVKTIKNLSNKVQHIIIQVNEKTQAVDRTTKSQEASIQEMTKASPDFAAMVGELTGISNYMSNE